MSPEASDQQRAREALIDARGALATAVARLGLVYTAGVHETRARLAIEVDNAVAALESAVRAEQAASDTAQRERLERQFFHEGIEHTESQESLIAAQARIAALEQALQEIVDGPLVVHSDGCSSCTTCIARAALKGSNG